MSFLSITASESLRAEWHALRDDITPWIGERATTLFAHAVCDAYDCLPLALHFRKLLVDAGDDPDNPQVTETEQLLIDWGRLIARDPHGIPQSEPLGVGGEARQVAEQRRVQVVRRSPIESRVLVARALRRLVQLVRGGDRQEGHAVSLSQRHPYYAASSTTGPDSTASFACAASLIG